MRKKGLFLGVALMASAGWAVVADVTLGVLGNVSLEDSVMWVQSPLSGAADAGAQGGALAGMAAGLFQEAEMRAADGRVATITATSIGMHDVLAELGDWDAGVPVDTDFITTMSQPPTRPYPPTPEPASGMLLAAGVGAMLLRRRKIWYSS